jgi:CMD domain protein
MTTSTTPDVIDELTGIRAGDALDAIRAQRAQARAQAQQSYLALFEPAPPVSGEDSAFTVAERFAIAAFVARLHRQSAVADFYAGEGSQRGTSPALLEAVFAEASGLVRDGARGPYGSYPAGPLSAQDEPGPSYAVSEPRRAQFGPRLAAALVHAHLLVLHPRDATAAHLQALLDADWSTDDIVTLSQLVAFVAFQIRVVVGLRNLGGRPGSTLAA